MPSAATLGATLASKRQEHAAWLASKKTADGYDMTAEQVGEFNTRNEELVTLQKEFDQTAAIEKSAAENEQKLAPQGRIIREDSEPEAKSVDGEDLLDREFKAAFKAHAPALKAVAEGDLSKGFPRFELSPVASKTLVSLTHHYPPAQRLQTTPSALYYNSVEDIFQSGSTSSNNVEYFIQTTDTDNAAAVAEGSAVTDSAFAWTKTTDEVEIMQTWIPVTREFLNDNEGMQSIITGMLSARLDKYISKQLMYGTGTTPELWGASIRTGVQTQAKGSDPAFDAILKAITLVEVTGDATPDHLVIHPTDWQNLILTTTSDGVYILGNPGNTPANPTLWGLPIRVSSTVASSAGTALVGAFRTMTQIFNNGGLVVETSTEHSTYFTERKVALALHRRLSVASYRPSAFCKVTGL